MADGLIASGAVRVNGRKPPATGMMVEPGADEVTVDGAESLSLLADDAS